MNETELNWSSSQGFGSISSYNEDDVSNIQRDFETLEFNQRVDGATGFWGSPVLYDDGDKVILLNKSGTLISLSANFLGHSADTIWHRNLRHEERGSRSNSHKLEYMSTPTLIGSNLYILGLQKLFIVDVNEGDLINTIPLPLVGDDQFIAPLTYDKLANGNLSLYAISKEQKVFFIDSSNTVKPIDFDSDYKNCWSA